MKSNNEILDELMDELNEEESDLFINNKFPYILTKAYYYLRDGSEKYGSTDAFNLPNESWSKSDLDEMESGCKQIVSGKGFRKEYPLENLSIRGCYLLFKLFHFKSVKQKATKMDNGNMLDEIEFEHVMDGTKVIYYNEISY